MLFTKCGRRLDGGVGGLGSFHHLAQLHHRDRVEKVHVAAARRVTGEVGEAADGDGAGVAGDDGVPVGVLAELAEHLALGVEVLDHGLDD
jgi:hypothetical protein